MKKIVVFIIAVTLFGAACKNGKGWSSSDRKQFLSTCTGAAKGAMGEEKANSYCDCMQKKLEVKYPDPRDANKVTSAELEKPEWAADIQSCLK